MLAWLSIIRSSQNYEFPIISLGEALPFFCQFVLSVRHANIIFLSFFPPIQELHPDKRD